VTTDHSFVHSSPPPLEPSRRDADRTLDVPESTESALNDHDASLGDLERLRRLAELARGADGGLLTDDADVAEVLDAAESVIGAMRDEARILAVLVAFLRDHAHDVAIAGAEDESQAGFDFCMRAADQITQVAATVRDVARTVPPRSLAERPRLIDAQSCELTAEERESTGSHFILYEHRAGAELPPDAEPCAAYTNDTAAEHVARQRAEELPAGMHVSVYEADGLERLPDRIYLAPGTGGSSGLVARRDAA
jgi:hypothetical protein